MNVRHALLLLRLFSLYLVGGEIITSKSLHIIIVSKGDNIHHNHVAKNFLIWLNVLTEISLFHYKCSISHIIQHDTILSLANPYGFSERKVFFCDLLDTRMCVTELVRDQLQKFDFVVAFYAQQLTPESPENILKFINFGNSGSESNCSDIFVATPTKVVEILNGKYGGIDSVSIQSLNQSCRYYFDEKDEPGRIPTLAIQEDNTNKINCVENLDWPIAVTNKYLRSQIKTSA